jgi:hypothetical protein
MKQHEVEPGDCFHEWGPPTSQPMWRPVPGGLLGGQFYNKHRAHREIELPNPCGPGIARQQPNPCGPGIARQQGPGGQAR